MNTQDRNSTNSANISRTLQKTDGGATIPKTIGPKSINSDRTDVKLDGASASTNAENNKWTDNARKDDQPRVPSGSSSGIGSKGSEISGITIL